MVSVVAGEVVVPETAVMLSGPPAFTKVTEPFPPDPGLPVVQGTGAFPLLLTVAVVVSDEIQVTALVMSSDGPLEKVPVAQNWTEPVPRANDTLPPGLSAIDSRFESVTVTLVEPETVLD